MRLNKSLRAALTGLTALSFRHSLRASRRAVCGRAAHRFATQRIRPTPWR